MMTDKNSDEANPARLLMNRGEFSEMALETLDSPPEANEGEAVFRIGRFALTVNNVTYATFGDRLHYWDFFPVDRAGWGQLPVWGYADVVESKADGVEAGQRYYGYWPAATHVKLHPGKVGERSFRDDVAHRAKLPEIYNWYQRTDDDPLHDAQTEPLHAIYRPLFVTAFCLADFLAENDFFGARKVLISSASSKTAYAVAYCIRRHSKIAMVGLTSSGNLAFVRRLGLYDEALPYDDRHKLDTGEATLYIDIAGNPKLQADIHEHLRANLVYDCSVGSAQSHVPPTPAKDLPGPNPEFFFAPNWISRRYKDWGVGEFNRRSGKAGAAFFEYVTGNGLIELSEHTGLEAAREVLAEMIEGNTDPAKGHVIAL
ncbi:MAG TPA: DUF2855 family protein [Wenzhouxiangellaceae bacterium]|nr:DUF2855 family protein [Wenzhouxiangellaceae bacterium]